MRAKLGPVTLQVVGYQFPTMRKDPSGYDMNWLKIKVGVNCQELQFERTSACLLSIELKKLYEWFHDIWFNIKTTKHLSFIEPCLSVIKQRKKFSFDFVFDYEFRPINHEKPCSINVTTSEEELKSFIDSLAKQIKKYPTRGIWKK